MNNLNMLWCCFLVIYFFSSCTGNEETLQFYFKNGDDGILNDGKCVGSTQWTKDGNVLAEDNVHFQFNSSSGKLTIKAFADGDVGLYKCQNVGGDLLSFRVNSATNVTAFQSKSKNLVEGDELELKCNANGITEVVWQKDNETVVADGTSRVVFAEFNSVTNGILKITSLEFDDAGNYSCTAGLSTKNIVVRVKDKLAALYPFLGIVCEVIIFCTIIACYERKRAKKMAEDDQPEEAGHLTNSMEHKNDVEVRLRK